MAGNSGDLEYRRGRVRRDRPGGFLRDGRKKTTVKPPQAVLKVLHSRTGSIGTLVKYVALEKESGSLREGVVVDGLAISSLEDLEVARKLLLEQQYTQRRKNGRIATHMILSASCPMSAENQQKVMDSALEVVSDHLSEYFTVAVVHKDSKHLHAHVVIQPWNWETGKKMRLQSDDLKEMRQTFAQALTARGLEHSAETVKKRDRVRGEKYPVLARLGPVGREKLIRGLKNTEVGNISYMQDWLQKVRSDPDAAGIEALNARLDDYRKVYGESGVQVGKMLMEVEQQYKQKRYLSRYEKRLLVRTSSRLELMAQDPEKMRGWVNAEAKRESVSGRSVEGR